MTTAYYCGPERDAEEESDEKFHDHVGLDRAGS
jgi:hypothetical protein